MRKPNSITVLLYIYTYNSSSETEAKRSAILFRGEHSKGLSNQADVELDMINALQQMLHLSCQIFFFLTLVIFSLYIRYVLDGFIILDLLFYYYFNVTCKAHLNIFI